MPTSNTPNMPNLVGNQARHVPEVAQDGRHVRVYLWSVNSVKSDSSSAVTVRGHQGFQRSVCGPVRILDARRLRERIVGHQALSFASTLRSMPAITEPAELRRQTVPRKGSALSRSV
ncbi:hypothetical protein [Kibdelosporangium philippinense]|uniref:hypothetical protein n=1 Tax=Kibdelosporangium philippinense TaxID=211113 RepID=UPI0036127BC3